MEMRTTSVTDRFFVYVVAPLEEDEEQVKPERDEDPRGVGPEGDGEGILLAERRGTRDPEEGCGQDTRRHGGEHPRDEDTRDTTDGELARFADLVPHDGVYPAGTDPEPNHATDAGVGGGDGHLEERGEQEPQTRGPNHAEHTQHVNLGLLGEVFVVHNAGTDGVRDDGAETHGTRELKDGGDEAGLRNGEGARAHGGGEGVSQIIGSDTVRREEGEGGTHTDHPLVVVPHHGC